MVNNALNQKMPKSLPSMLCSVYIAGPPDFTKSARQRTV